eukprot:804815-Pelagomonas_calceolata.AAC.11
MGSISFLLIGQAIQDRLARKQPRVRMIREIAENRFILPKQVAGKRRHGYVAWVTAAYGLSWGFQEGMRILPCSVPHLPPTLPHLCVLCSGYVAWVTAAFGPFWGFQEGVWSWLSGVTDNSLYPVMLAANLQLFVPELGEPGWPRR